MAYPTRSSVAQSQQAHLNHTIRVPIDSDDIIEGYVNTTGLSFLTHYKRHHQLSTSNLDVNPSYHELFDVVSKHYANWEVDEQDVVKGFLRNVKRRKLNSSNRLESLPSHSDVTESSTRDKTPIKSES
ncbi:hypothetical protein BKA69DRAFT_1121607 [Paraphysoderma sedebokerense]|nr:hypothetical protein BKA69DRAFT_1121607 [Paraphysoderma sedebokerense]